MLFGTCVNHFKRLTVLGGGTMGGGIAQVAAAANLPVVIVETADDRIAFSRKTIVNSLSRIAKKKCNGDEAMMKESVANTMRNLTWTTDRAKGVEGADLVIEAIIENLDLKKELFAELDGMAPKDAVFCSNTSSLSIKAMAGVTKRPERFAGVHFFSPVPMMGLVEVVKTDVVDPAVIQDLCEFARQVGKSPVVASDTEGFIVNRLLVPYQMEACRLVERGVASFEDVDTAMKLGCGYPMGPFELADSVGIDVLKFIVDGWHKQFPDEKLFEPTRIIDERVAAGKLGKKTGEGFYKYDDKGRRVPQAPR